MANEAVLDRLADAYQQSFSRVQIAAERAAQDAWLSFDSFAGDDEDRWSEAFWAILFAAAATASALAARYMQWQLDVEGIPVQVPDPDLDWLSEDFDVWHTSPMIAARVAISKGADPVEAMGAAATQVTVLANAAIREAEQRSLDQIIDGLFDLEVDVTYEEVDPTASREQAQARPRAAFRRIPQDGACGWCRVVADRIYSAKAKKNHPLGAWHNYCRCTWRKVTAQEASEWKPRYVGGEWKSVVQERADLTTGDET